MSITQELGEMYRHFLDGKRLSSRQDHPKFSKLNEVGIVGGGMAGLYCALLLNHYQPNVTVKIFEATDRVGGRVRTHRFSRRGDVSVFRNRGNALSRNQLAKASF